MVSSATRGISYLVIAVTVVTGVLLGAFTLQRREALRAGASTDSAVLALTAMLDQETGVRGYLYTGDAVFLEPYLSGQTNYDQQRLAVMRATAGAAASARLAAQEDVAAISWEKWAAEVVAARGLSSAPPVDAVDQELLGKQHMDSFRTYNTALRASLDHRRDALLRRTGFISTTAVVVLAALLVLAGYV